MKPQEAKNHYEDLIIEDLKPAGFEPVKIHGGEQLFARELKSLATEKMFEKSGIASSPAIHYQANRPNPAQIGKQLYGPLSPQLRDRKTALFIDKLPREIREIRYTRRAEVPDRFHALPYWAAPCISWKSGPTAPKSG